MSFGIIETVVVKIDGVKVRINKQDMHLYDQQEQEYQQETVTVTADEKASEAVQNENSPKISIVKKGKQFNVVVDGKIHNPKPITKTAAIALVKELSE